jgi:hypothetical protein
MNNLSKVLVRNNYAPEIPFTKNALGSKNDKLNLGTVFSNLAYYGYTLSKETIEILASKGKQELVNWWNILEPILKELSGESRNMTEFVVYKNFPNEVLNMSDAEYWFNQICMYIGFPNEFFTKEELNRQPINGITDLKVLHYPDDNTYTKLLNNLFNVNSLWSNPQLEDVLTLIGRVNIVDYSDIVFKDNMISILTEAFNNGKIVKITSATDVLRLAISVSGGNMNSFEKIKFKKWKRAERRYFLNLLENCFNTADDFARNEPLFKTFLKGLHVEDYKFRFPRVFRLKQDLFDGKLHTFNSLVDNFLKEKNTEVFKILKSKKGQGVFLRSLVRLTNVFDAVTVSSHFNEVIHNYDTIKLLKLKKFFENVNHNTFRVFTPKGKFTKMQVANNDININTRPFVRILELELKRRASLLGKVYVDDRVKNINFQTKENENFSFGKGTSYIIPDNISFVRSASYWKSGDTHYSNIWYDNGWNFFDSDWKSIDSICWSRSKLMKNNKPMALFSGDPTNSKTSDGQATQVIDLYIDELKNNSVRYAVWSVLCFSRKKFNEAIDVFASLQWGEDANVGEIFEPSRAQVSFPLKGNEYSKFVAYVDLFERKLVFLDLSLNVNVQSATSNSSLLEEKMPPLIEYINSTTPSLFDFLKYSNQTDDLKSADYVALYSDDSIKLDGEKCFILKPVNPDNKYTSIQLNEFLQ